jgi:hypothetical protein
MAEDRKIINIMIFKTLTGKKPQVCRRYKEEPVPQ